MSMKCVNERSTSRSVSRVCPVCGKRFFARSHQRLCRQCKQTVKLGRWRFREM